MNRFASVCLRVAKVAALFVFPLVLLFASALVTMLVAIKSADIAVPGVVGKPRQDAEKDLEKARLRALVAETRFSQTIPQGCVISQTPEASLVVKANSAVRLVVSEGRKRVVMPSLTGMSAQNAQAVLSQSGLKKGLVSYAPIREQVSESVLDQFPAAGSTDVSSPYVNLLFNSPSDATPYVMPDFTGIKVGDASAFLEKNGFRTGSFEYESRLLLPSGQVVGHRPGAGEPVTRSVPIVLVLSR